MLLVNYDFLLSLQATTVLSVFFFYSYSTKKLELNAFRCSFNKCELFYKIKYINTFTRILHASKYGVCNVLYTQDGTGRVSLILFV